MPDRVSAPVPLPESDRPLLPDRTPEKTAPPVPLMVTVRPALSVSTMLVEMMPAPPDDNLIAAPAPLLFIDKIEVDVLVGVMLKVLAALLKSISPTLIVVAASMVMNWL